jgi:hypothetical protein
MPLVEAGEHVFGNGGDSLVSARYGSKVSLPLIGVAQHEFSDSVPKQEVIVDHSICPRKVNDGTAGLT